MDTTVGGKQISELLPCSVRSAAIIYLRLSPRRPLSHHSPSAQSADMQQQAAVATMPGLRAVDCTKRAMRTAHGTRDIASKPLRLLLPLSATRQEEETKLVVVRPTED